MTENVSTLWLTDAEVAALTRRVRQQAQLKQLKALVMMHAVRFRIDGSFMVLRQAIEPTKSQKSFDLTLDRLRRSS